jgi:hypothetical protein
MLLQKKKRKNTKIKDCFRFYCGKLNRLHTIHKWKKGGKRKYNKTKQITFFFVVPSKANQDKYNNSIFSNFYPNNIVQSIFHFLCLLEKHQETTIATKKNMEQEHI